MQQFIPGQLADPLASASGFGKAGFREQRILIGAWAQETIAKLSIALLGRKNPRARPETPSTVCRQTFGKSISVNLIRSGITGAAQITKFRFYVSACFVFVDFCRFDFCRGSGARLCEILAGSTGATLCTFILGISTPVFPPSVCPNRGSRGRGIAGGIPWRRVRSSRGDQSRTHARTLVPSVKLHMVVGLGPIIFVRSNFVDFSGSNCIEVRAARMCEIHA